MNLKEIRKKQNKTQCEVAEEADIARAYYTQIEMGMYRPSVETAKRIAKVLNIDWTEFFNDEGDREDSN